MTTVKMYKCKAEGDMFEEKQCGFVALDPGAMMLHLFNEHNAQIKKTFVEEKDVEV